MRKYLVFLLMLMSSLAFCDTGSEERFYRDVVRIANESLGLRVIPAYGNDRFTSDCIGFVLSVYKKAGLDLRKLYGDGRGGVSSLYDGLEKRGWVFQDTVAKPGDLIFFDHTYDINRNGKWDDPLSHIGIITEVGKHQTMTYIHFGSGRVEEEKINLSYPRTHAFKRSDGGLTVINSYLRRDRGEGFERRMYVASYFYRSFARIPVKYRRLD